MKTTKKYLLFVLLCFLPFFITACDWIIPIDDTVVEISMVDQTGTLDPNQKYIMSIYDPNNDQDFRYSQYSTKRYVKFTDVDPGNYRAHAQSGYTMGENAFELSIDKGDHIVIVFTYYNSYSTNIQVPSYYGGGVSIPVTAKRWKYSVSYQ